MARRHRLRGRTLFPATHLPVVASRYRVIGDLVPHDHDFVEAVLVLAGAGRHRTSHGIQTLAPGDAFLLRPGAWHTFEDCAALEVYNVCFGVGLLRRELAGLLGEPTIRHLLVSGPLAAGGVLSFRLPPDELAFCSRLVETIRERGESAEPLDGIEKVGVLVQFLARLARAVAPPPGAESMPTLHPSVQELLAKIEADPAANWNLDTLASSAQLEKSYLARVFKSATGLAPVAYVARARLEFAASLLLRTDLPVQSVAEQVGIADPNLFARRFRSHFGMSASSYRARFANGRI